MSLTTHLNTPAPAREARPSSSHGRLRWNGLLCISVAADTGPLTAAIAARTPVVVDDLAAEWPALERWTPATLAARFGDRRVKVYDARFGEPGANYMGSIDQIPFRDFLATLLAGERDLRMFLHNLSHAMPELLEDVRFPDIGLRFSRQFVFSFFGARGTTTPLHFDIDMGDVLHTAVLGRRRIRLFAPADATALYRHPCTVRSYVDLDAPDRDRHPAIDFATGHEVVLEPGQTLYMPAGWWHEFHYLEAGIGVSLRASSPLWRDRQLGALHLLLTSPADRIANKIAPEAWYAWKDARAAKRADVLIKAEQP